MNAPNAIIKTTVADIAAAAVPRVRHNPAHRRKPSPLPLRPLVADRFKPPKGQKKVFLPNFTLTFLRTPTQPANFASFLTPLWLNKLDLKDYLYNLYGVQALRVRSFIINGKMLRESRTGRAKRATATKKMTVELAPAAEATGGSPGGQGPFVWPEEPADLRPWGMDLKLFDKKLKEESKKIKRQETGELEKEDRESLRETARALLEGRARWTPSWETNGGAGAMGRQGVRSE